MTTNISPPKRRHSQVDVHQVDSERNSSRRKIENDSTELTLDYKNLESYRELEYPSTSTSGSSRVPAPPPFQYPYQLISFSYTPSRELEFTDSALRYYAIPPRGADLSFRYDSWVKRPEERGRLDGLLEACLHKQVLPESKRANAVSWRGVMTKILTAPYEERDGWELNVMNVADVLYFEEHTTEDRLKEKENMTPRNRLQTYYGYAFESYATSATPNPSDDTSRAANGWSGDVNTNVQWCSVVKTKLGNLRLLVGGEVDCVKEKYTGQPNTFVELKTSMTIRGPTDEARFEKKLLKFYFQSFLLGVPEIVVGFRTPSGRINDLQSFKTIELPRLVRGKAGAWDPNICLSWGEQFISFLKASIDELHGHSTDGSSSQKDKDEGEEHTSKESVWRVSFKPGKGVIIRLLDAAEVEEVRNGEERIGFLPITYYNKITKIDK